MTDQFLLDLRRDLDKACADMGELAKFALALDSKIEKLGKYSYSHFKKFNNHIDTLYDMVAPIEQKLFPEVNRVRGKFEKIRTDLAKEKPDSDGGE